MTCQRTFHYLYVSWYKRKFLKKKNTYTAILRMKLQINRTVKLQNIPLPTRKIRCANDIFGSVWWDEYL